MDIAQIWVWLVGHMVFQNLHINNTVDDGDCSFILLAAIAVSLKRPPHIFSTGDDSELHNIKISPLLCACHSCPLQSSVIAHHPSPLATIHRWGESITGEYSRLKNANTVRSPNAFEDLSFAF
ncbi:hypothetical protein K439DRAFT_1617627 [Ramaria rubella]|nr:hypothetical protein K439DRAFT_1617627 [Ramaria rubella]